jgi:alpha-tubulin suppressor-like RCC1 family protein
VGLGRVRADGSLWAWGSNSKGQLGLGDTENRLTPTEVGNFWIAVAAGGSHTLGVDSMGNLCAWGDNYHGQIGLGGTGGEFHEPVVVDWVVGFDPPKIPWDAVVAGNSHSFASNGWWFVWGGNWLGQLGLGDTDDRLVPVNPYWGFAGVSAGYAHSLGLAYNGSLWTWGWNSSGQLGLGDTDDRLSPTQINTGASKWVAVSAGEEYCLGIRDVGDLWSWGGNTEGQLGTGDTTYRHSPTPTAPYPTSTDWQAVSAGWRHALGVRKDGSLWAWGLNSYGQLGLGDTANRLTPTLVRFPAPTPGLPLLLLD